MQIILIIVGALAGALAGGEGGALLGALLGWLVGRSLRQQREIDALRAALRAAPRAAEDLNTGLAQPGQAQPGATPETPAAAAAAAAWRTREPPVVPAAPGPRAEPAALPPRAERPAPPATPARSAPAPGPGALDRLIGAAREGLFGGNTVVKAGIGILFIGLAFLAKYASEHVQLPVELQLAGIGLAAIVLLVIGWRLRERRAGYAQVLQGGAIAVLYLTLFSAFKFYGLLGAGPVFGLMALVAALAAALAVLQNAAALAVIGALGGFATPILLSTGGGSHIGLFSYYLLLDLGIAAVAWFRTWRALNLVGFGFSFGVAALWGLFRYRDEHYVSAQLFLAAFFVVFVAVLLLPARRLAGAAEATGHRADRWVDGSLLFGLPVVAFGLQYGLAHDTRYGVALSALAAAAFYVALAAWLRARPRLALAFEGSLAVGTVFLTLVIPFALDARATAGAWALEGAGLVWLGWRQRRALARAFGYALIVVAGALLAHAVNWGGELTGWVNATMLSGVMLTAGALLAARFVFRHAPPGQPAEDGGAALSERWAEPLLIGWALLAALGTLVLHVGERVGAPWQLAALLAGTAGLALLHVVLARHLAWPNVALPVLGFAPWLLVAAWASAVLEKHPFVHGGWWAWPAAIAAHLVALRLAAAFWPAWARHATHAVGALVIATLGMAAGRGVIEGLGDAGSAWPWLGWLAAPALLLLALPRPALATLWPVSDAPAAYQRSAGLVLAAGMLLWTLLANTASNGAAQPLPHVPLINPLDLGVALALFAAWRWFTSEPGRSQLARSAAGPWLPAALIGACAFAWLNAMLVRAFHHLADVPFSLHAWSRSLAVQTGLTLLWTATALPLMWWSARRGLRAPWMVGAALLGAVVLKLLLVDLSATGTVTRIVSFIGAGVLMLVIGYVAPLPSREASHAKA
jgi:uncharacterized membrane protein